MGRMECGCGQEFALEALPYRPFVSCPNCGRRLPVHCDPAEFMGRCRKCGRFLEEKDLDIHCLVCSGKNIVHI